MDLTREDLDGLTAWAVIRSAHYLERRLTELLALLDLSPVQFGVLAHLATGAALTRAQLAREVLVRPQSLTGVLNDLIGRGLITSEGLGGKGRRNPLALTTAGRALLEVSWPVVSEANSPELLNITAGDASRLREVLRTMITDPLHGGQQRYH